MLYDTICDRYVAIYFTIRTGLAIGGFEQRHFRCVPSLIVSQGFCLNLMHLVLVKRPLTLKTYKRVTYRSAQEKGSFFAFTPRTKSLKREPINVLYTDKPKKKSSFFRVHSANKKPQTQTFAEKTPRNFA